jgi:hypothetical protein
MESTCPDITVWQKFLDGSIAQEDRAASESHLVRCRLCREQLIALSDTAREETLSEPAPDSLKNRAISLAPPKSRPSFIGSWRPYVPLALAAAIVLAVGLSVVVYRNKTKPPPAFELRQSDRATIALSLSSPTDGAVMEPGQLEFRWGDCGPGARYEFTITDEKGDIVFQEKPANNFLTLDSRALKLSSQRKYYWTVSARLPDGTKRESAVAGFTLK